MLFHSPVFLLCFLPITLAIYLALERNAAPLATVGFLAVASLFFYSWWNPYYLPLLLGSIAFNFSAGQYLMPETAGHYRRAVLAFAICADIVLLALFKYADFVVSNVNLISDVGWSGLGIVLPLAISFFTFQQIAYLVDAYQGKAPERSFTAYCLFITFFPHLIAGPIVHHREMMPQFSGLLAGRFRSQDKVWSDLAVGFTLFAIGLLKKVAIAGQFGLWADNAFRASDAGGQLSFVEAWLGTMCFSLQIYLDFSGYTDMALGLARLFGIRLPLNFNSPYKATNIIDFWRCWHMTLSRFLRDYLYFPLGGNRRGTVRRYENLIVVMLIGGLWHGAAWTFVIWGGLHGLYLAVNHGYRELVRRGFPEIPAIAGLLVTTVCVLLAWTFFRAETAGSAMRMVMAMAGLHGVALPIHWQPLFGNAVAASGLPIHFAALPAYSGGTQVLWVVAGFLAMWLLPNSQEILRRFKPALESVSAPCGLISRIEWRPSILSGVAMSVVTLALTFIVLQGKAGEFIYFQF
jgi:D-alanyl-lipoteichoic acid acyltransferase DltB (MBOAT superfamily)